jgi:hypothetical protein
MTEAARNLLRANSKNRYFSLMPILANQELKN